MFNGYLYNPLGDHTINETLDSVVTIAPPVTGAQLLIIQAFTKDVRYTLDGTDPDANTGFLLGANVSDILPVSVDTIVKVIEVEASASIQYQWADMRPAI